MSSFSYSKVLNFSVLLDIDFKNFTHSTGYFPILVSPDNIMASAPSYTAFATSVTSALVGVGFSIIDSSK